MTWHFRPHRMVASPFYWVNHDYARLEAFRATHGRSPTIREFQAVIMVYAPSRTSYATASVRLRKLLRWEATGERPSWQAKVIAKRAASPLWAEAIATWVKEAQRLHREAEYDRLAQPI